MTDDGDIDRFVAVDAVRTIIERADFDNIETVCDDLKISDARSYYLRWPILTADNACFGALSRIGNNWKFEYLRPQGGLVCRQMQV